jgi:hypothetical protein
MVKPIACSTNTVRMLNEKIGTKNWTPARAGLWLGQRTRMDLNPLRLDPQDRAWGFPRF